MLKSSLQETEYNGYFANYIYLVDDNTELINGLTLNKDEIIAFYKAIPEQKHDYKYESNKWSIKEVLQHIIDTERIFMYRFLRIARNDMAPLVGFDQNIYILPSEASKKSMNSLLEEFKVTREYSINLVSSISEENLKNIGIASDQKISARACAFLIIGHSKWHNNIIKERYL
ncbi:DinB family protein [Tenacibaculum geojense]|uniref:DinB family protein n=1 Tax=Tenacibaculum geojense TaxID=915352 RepID=A0ABW3JU79_9FLAO